MTMWTAVPPNVPKTVAGTLWDAEVPTDEWRPTSPTRSLFIVDSQTEGNGVYSADFFGNQRAGSASSADAIVPLVLALFSIKSVVDVGCGVGGWLNAFERRGVADYVGLDGDYVPRDMLKIPSSRFQSTDLRRLTDIGRQFDLACSMEVAEHLPESCAEQFVAALVAAAPVVLFSAAIPLQQGTDHINMQWQRYWSDLFASKGYITLDCIRPIIHEDPRVEWWYRQNALVFCKPSHCPPGLSPVTGNYALNRIDPGLLHQIANGPHGGKQALTMLRRCLAIFRSMILDKILPRALRPGARR